MHMLPLRDLLRFKSFCKYLELATIQASLPSQYNTEQVKTCITMPMLCHLMALPSFFGQGQHVNTSADVPIRALEVGTCKAIVQRYIYNDMWFLCHSNQTQDNTYTSTLARAPSLPNLENANFASNCDGSANTLRNPWRFFQLRILHKPQLELASWIKAMASMDFAWASVVLPHDIP